MHRKLTFLHRVIGYLIAFDRFNNGKCAEERDRL